MAFLMIRVEASALSVADMNAKLANSSNPQDGMIKLDNLMLAIAGGAIDAQVDCAVRDTTQAITAAGGGSSASYNLT
jgi:hypothetical protein